VNIEHLMYYHHIDMCSCYIQHQVALLKRILVLTTEAKSCQTCMRGHEIKLNSQRGKRSGKATLSSLNYRQETEERYVHVEAPQSIE